LKNIYLISYFILIIYIYNKIINSSIYPNIKISIPLQLLMILPPSSIDLIENTDQKKLMTDINKGVLHYYPIDFGISTYLKNWLWLCQPKLPYIDINLLNSKLK